MSATGEKTKKKPRQGRSVSGVWDVAVPPTVPGNGSHMTGTNVSNQKEVWTNSLALNLPPPFIELIMYCMHSQGSRECKCSLASDNTVKCVWGSMINKKENPIETVILI